jgi:uncharacterized RDD family membrane protein YckC
MKTILNLLSSILGIGILFIILCDILGLINFNSEPETIYGGLTFSLFLIWDSLKKNKTTTETFFEKENIEIPIWWKRFVGFSVDFIIISILYALITTAIAFSDISLKINETYGAFFFIFSPLFVFYYSLQEYFFKTSIGKSIFKLKIVSANEDSQLSFFQILIRTLSKLYLGHINFWLFTVKKPLGLHDILSKTAVVYRKKS